MNPSLRRREWQQEKRRGKEIQEKCSFRNFRGALKLATALWLSVPSLKVGHVGSGSGYLIENDSVALSILLA